MSASAQNPFCTEGTFLPWDAFPVNGRDLVEYQGGIYGIDAWLTGSLTRYDIASGQSIALSPPPFSGLGDVSLAEVNGKLYTFAGFAGGINQVQTQAHVYDIASDSWQTLPDLPIGITSPSAVAVGEDIYITGSTFGITTRYFMKYNIVSNSYTVLSIPDEQGVAKLVTYGGQVYSIGGYRFLPPYVTSSVFSVYNDASDSWQNLPDMPFPTLYSHAAVWGNYLHVFGGCAEFIDTWRDEYFVYDFVGNQWYVAENTMPFTPTYASAIAVNDTVYVISSNYAGSDVSFKYYCEQTTCISSIPVNLSGLESEYGISDGPVTMFGTPSGGVFIGPGVSGSLFSPATAGEGTHSVSYAYVDEFGCVNTASTCVSVSFGLGLIDEERGQHALKIYPNPNRGSFTVELDLVGLVSMQVFDSKGRAVHSEVFQSIGSHTVRNLDLSKLAAGNYVLQVQNEIGAVSQKVIIE